MKIESIKCNNCGASDFSKHPELDEFLICNTCDSQYTSQVRKITNDLPYDLKVKIKSNSSTFVANNAIINGNYNDIQGDYNIILGNSNTIVGSCNIPKGNYNVCIDTPKTFIDYLIFIYKKFL